MSVALALARRPVAVQDAPPDGRPPVAVRRPERPVPRLGAPSDDVLTASPWPLQFAGVKAQQQAQLAEDIDPSVHQWARDVLIPAWERVTGETPTLQEVQAAGAIAILESGYGRWWKSPCNTARNWGAVQCPKLPVDGVCPCEGCLYEDHHADGTAFAVCFLAYATDEDGAADLIKHITIHRPKTRAALKTGDANQISAAMYDERYYGGFGATREERIEGHIKALTTRAKQIATALGEPLVVVRGGSDPVDTAGKSLGGAGSVIDTAGKVFMGAALGVLAVVVGREVYQRVRR